MKGVGCRVKGVRGPVVGGAVPVVCRVERERVCVRECECECECESESVCERE